jgi:hypothetical protein
MNKRIDFSIFPIEKLDDGNYPRTLFDSVLIMANSDSEAYALTYRITIDSQNRTAKIIIEDEPEFGGKLNSDEEREGIMISF